MMTKKTKALSAGGRDRWLVPAMAFAMMLTACGGDAFTLAEKTDAESTTEDAGSDTSEHDAAGSDTSEHDAAAGDADARSCACLTDLSGVGLGDFAIAFTIKTTMHPVAPGYGAILNQRKTCDSGNPGWDVWLWSDGSFAVEIYNGTNIFDNVTDSRKINDGVEHRIVISRTSSATKVVIVMDGSARDFPGAPTEAVSGTLAPLLVGVEPICAGNGAQPSQPFVGSITNVCLAVDCVPL